MIYDAAVVGGGVMGLSAARALLDRGVACVVVLEREQVGHERAASTDTTRAIRYEYAQQGIYSRMVHLSIPMWEELARRSSRDLYVNSGVICWGRAADSHARLSYSTLRDMDIPIEEISPDELCRRYPQFSVADMSYATYNPLGGFLRASACVAAIAAEVRGVGGHIREGCEVVAVSEQKAGVTLRLQSGVKVEAARVVLTPGPWGSTLLPSLGIALPLTANKQQLVYVGGLGPEFAPSSFPVFLNLDHDFYGFPLDEQGVFKASIHFPGPVVDPDANEPVDHSFTQRVIELLRTYIPAATRGRTISSRLCMYAMTPDEDFVLDYAPGSKKIVMGVGFSGHGFKFGPLIGELLADLLLGRSPAISLQQFALARFGKRATG